MPDLLADSKIWKWGGVSFGEYDTMLLQKSFKALMRKLGGSCSQMRLWGKIKGTKMDYYVSEGTVEAAGGDDEEGGAQLGEPMDARGTGVNKYAYYVCNSPNEAW